MSEPDPPTPVAQAREGVPERTAAPAPGTVPGAVPGGLAGRLPARATGGAAFGGSDAVSAAPSGDAGSPDDTALMRAWCGGDDDAFDALYDRHRTALYRYVLNGCGDEVQARELFQDIWLRVVDARERWTPDAPFHAWLFRIARNRLIDHYRRRPDGRHEPFDEERMNEVSEIAPPLGPDEIASLIERGDVLHAALQRLPSAQREAIVLQHVAGMRLNEIADVVGENVETVKSRLRYAMSRLRGHLRAST